MAKSEAVSTSAIKADDAKPETVSADIVRLLDGVVIGWENITADGSPIAFDLALLPTVADFNQLCKLFWRSVDARFDIVMDVEKNSASPQCSGGEKCAGAVGAENAQTPQRN